MRESRSPGPAVPGEDSPSGRSIGLMAGIFFLVAGILMFATESDYGVASDVGNYFYSSMRQLSWLQKLAQGIAAGQPLSAMSPEVLNEHWRWMPIRLPHPPLSREISGISWLLFRDLIGTVSAYRVGVMSTFAFLTAGCAAFTAAAAGSLLAGIGAGLSVLTIPVLFAHGHLAHTDLFLAAFWFGSAATLFRWLEKSRGRDLLLSGLLLGAAVSTKFSGLLAIPVMGLWVLLRRPRRFMRAALVIGPTALAVFFLTNPILWVEPAQGLADYFGAGFGRSEEALNLLKTLYFGTFYVYRGPWHYPFVWTLIVLPPTILAAILAGLLAGLTDRITRPLVQFCLLNASVLYAALMLPTAPMHDGVRLILPAFPFFAVLGGVGTARIAESVESLPVLRGRLPAYVLAGGVVALLFVPSAAAVVRTHPYQLSYVNMFVGGVDGAERRGLEIANLKEILSEDVLSDLATFIPAGAVIDPGFLLEEICFAQTLGRAPRSWVIETRWPSLIPDQPDLNLVCAGDEVRAPTVVNRDPAPADYLLQYNRKAMWRPIDWAMNRQGDPPAYEITLEGAPLLRVYRFQ
jgi:hypothetical protein